MKEIAVMSGKGGTGKTSITAALGTLAGQMAVVADCDVGAANLHLLYHPEDQEAHPFWSGKTAVIDGEACNDCGVCLEKCRFDAIDVRDNRHVVDEVSCEGCSVCHHLCPVDAISMADNLSGDWFISKSRFGNWFVRAKLRIGQENSGKLVATVREEAKKLAKRENIPYVIVDGPPGIGCPAIAACSGISHVLIVTEATQSGLHDLERLVGLINFFKVSASCVINKHDLNAEVSHDIESFCETRHIEVINKIPFDPLFSVALQEGKTLVETGNGWVTGKIEEIWNQLQ